MVRSYSCYKKIENVVSLVFMKKDTEMVNPHL